VSQENPIEVRKRHIRRCEPIEQVSAYRRHRRPDVDQGRHLAIEEVRVVLPLEDVVPQRNPVDVHTI
jgi:hypothetical protein